MTKTALRAGEAAFQMNYSLAIRDPVNGVPEMIDTILYMMENGVDVKAQFGKMLDSLEVLRVTGNLEALQEKEPNLETLQGYLKEHKRADYLKSIESTLRSKN